MKEHKWHKTSQKLPDPKAGMVAGLWNEEDGRQIVEICFYDHDDNKWYDDGCGIGNYGDFVRQPDFWIEIPRPKETES